MNAGPSDILKTINAEMPRIKSIVAMVEFDNQTQTTYWSMTDHKTLCYMHQVLDIAIKKEINKLTEKVLGK